MDIWAGTRLMRFLALEAQFQWTPGIKVKGAPGKLDPLVYTVNVRGYLPLGRFQPYAVFGIGGMTMDFSAVKNRSAFVTKFGVGLDYYATEHVALVASWNYNLATGDLDGFSFNTLSFGAQYKF